MAESHSEDYPLLGCTDPPSPDECSPGLRVVRAASWDHSFRNDGGDHSGSGTPRVVPSQTSMDSGCDCDPSEGDTPPRCENRIHSSRGEFSPLSPSQPCSSEPCSLGPSEHVTPFAQKESEENHCGARNQKRVCDVVASNGGPVPKTKNSGGAILTHTDKGDLQNIIGIHSHSGSPNSQYGGASSSSNGKVTFRIEGYEDAENDLVSSAVESVSQCDSEPGNEFKELVRSATRSFPRVTSYSKAGMLSTSSSTASMPMCRICHFPQGEGVDMLISPCRCSGTMQFIHESCLMKWLEISSKRKKPATCELCYYQFNRHKKFKFSHWKLPPCSRVDKILHIIFVLCLTVMITCATITIYCFKQVGHLDRFIKKKEDTDLTKSEIVTLTCGVLFFVAFFMAMYVEVKAKNTLYRLFNKFLYLNQTWHIDEYDKRRDQQHAPV